MSQEIAEIASTPEATDITYQPSSAIDPARLDYLWTLSERMALMTIVPESLKTHKPAGAKDAIELPFEKIVANVFAVVEQADRWNVSPMGLLACAAIVHGRLGFEGKVIASVLESRYNLKLNYVWSGEGDQMSISITATDPRTGELVKNPITGEPLVTEGTVAEWKTTTTGSPWKPATYRKMLAYRGAREFSRIHKPSAMLGVYGDDELHQISEDARAHRAREIGSNIGERFSAGGNGFNAEGVTKQIAAATDKPMDTSIKNEPQGQKVGVTGGDETKADQQQTAGADQKPDVPRLDPQVFIDYNGALARMNSSENVLKSSDKFWEEKGGKPANPKDATLAKKIRDAQLSRAKGEIEASAINDQLETVISESFEVKI